MLCHSHAQAGVSVAHRQDRLVFQYPWVHQALLDELQDGACQREPCAVDGRLGLVSKCWSDWMPRRVQYLAHHPNDGGVEGCLIKKLASAGHHLSYHD